MSIPEFQVYSHVVYKTLNNMRCKHVP